MDDWTKIKYERIVDGEVEHTSFGGEIIVKSCFEPCSKQIRTQVETFLSNPEKQVKTFSFDGFKIRLTK